MSDAFSDAFVNPGSVGGQKQNLTGDIIPLGGTGITDPALLGGSQSAPGWGGTPQASGSGGAPVSGFSLPNISDVFKGMMNGPGESTGVSGECSWTNWTACQPIIRDFAVRGAIVVLGFIFIAAGLFMFGRNTAVPVVRDIAAGRR